MRSLTRSLQTLLLASAWTTASPNLEAQQLLQNPDLNQGLTGWSLHADPADPMPFVAPALLNGRTVPAIHQQSSPSPLGISTVMRLEQTIAPVVPPGLYVVRATCRWDVPLPLYHNGASAFVSIFQPSFYDVLDGDTVAQQPCPNQGEPLTEGTRLGTVFEFDQPTSYTLRFVAQTWFIDQGTLQVGSFRFERAEGLAIYPRGTATDPTLHLVIYATPGEYQFAEFFFDDQQLSAPVSLPGLDGVFGLVNPRPLFTQPIPPEGGRIDRSFPLPPDPRLLGRDLFVQGLGVGPTRRGLSNTIDVSFR